MDPIERTPFGRRLFESREAAGYTQVDAAKAIGMSQGTLGEAEISGKRSGFTSQLAALYRVNPTWLATGKADGDESGEDSSTPKRHRKLVDRLCELAEQINDIGLKKALLILDDFPRHYPVTEKKPRNRAKAA